MGVKFENGTEVIVARNSERIDYAARLGWAGEVIGHSSKDAIVQFADGCIGYVYEDDLEKL